MSGYISDLINKCRAQNPGELSFCQTVEYMLKTIEPAVDRHPEFIKERVLERLIEPERVLNFRAPWIDEKGDTIFTRIIRVQFNSALGPYWGKMRFHRFLGLGVIKTMAFHQIFKSSLTTLPLGGGYGGADIDLHNLSISEQENFFQALMKVLWSYIGPNVDVITSFNENNLADMITSYLEFGRRVPGLLADYYKQLTSHHFSHLSGDSNSCRGNLFKEAAIGYGIVYFAAEMLNMKGDTLKGKRAIISGSGKIALKIIEKLLEFDAKPLTVSDLEGYIYDEEGIDYEKLAFLGELKTVRWGSLEEYKKKYPHAVYHHEQRQWHHKADIAFPCYVDNEIDGGEAQLLVNNGIKIVVEGELHAISVDGRSIFTDNKIPWGPSSVSCIGDEIIPGLNFTNNSRHIRWTEKKLDDQLRRIIKKIHQNCREAAQCYGAPGNYQVGAGIAGFLPVAKAMMARGIIDPPNR